MQFVQLLAAVLLPAGNSFFVAVEFAVTRARPTMVVDLVERGVQGEESRQHAVRHIDAYLSARRLDIKVCSTGLGITAEPVVAHAFESLFGGGERPGIAVATAALRARLRHRVDLPRRAG